MAGQVRIEIIFDDRGRAVIQRVAKDTTDALNKIRGEGRKTADEVERSSKRIEDAHRRMATTRFTGLIGSFGALGGAVRSFAASATQHLKYFLYTASMLSSKLAVAFGLGGGVFGVAALGMFTKKMIEANSAMDKFSVQYGILYKDATLAQKKLNEAIEFSRKTPFILPEIIETQRLLKVMTNGALDTAKGLTLIGDAASGTGRDVSQLALWIGRAWQAATMGGAYGRSLFYLQQVGIISIDAKNKLLEFQKAGIKGQQAWGIIEKGLLRYKGMMAEMAKTLPGIWSNIWDSMFKFNLTMGQGLYNLIRDDLAKVFEMMNDVIENGGGKAAQRMRQIGANIAGAYLTIKETFKLIGGGIKEAFETISGATGANKITFHDLITGWLTAVGTITAGIKLIAELFAILWKGVADECNAAMSNMTTAWNLYTDYLKFTGGDKILEAVGSTLKWFINTMIQGIVMLETVAERAIDTLAAFLTGIYNPKKAEEMLLAQEDLVTVLNRIANIDYLGKAASMVSAAGSKIKNEFKGIAETAKISSDKIATSVEEAMNKAINSMSFAKGSTALPGLGDEEDYGLAEKGKTMAELIGSRNLERTAGGFINEPDWYSEYLDRTMPTANASAESILNSEKDADKLAKDILAEETKKAKEREQAITDTIQTVAFVMRDVIKTGSIGISEILGAAGTIAGAFKGGPP